MKFSGPIDRQDESSLGRLVLTGGHLTKWLILFLLLSGWVTWFWTESVLVYLDASAVDALSQIDWNERLGTFIFLFATAPLLVLLGLFAFKQTRIDADEDGLTLKGFKVNEKIAWEDITQVDLIGRGQINIGTYLSQNVEVKANGITHVLPTEMSHQNQQDFVAHLRKRGITVERPPMFSYYNWYATLHVFSLFVLILWVF